MKDELLKKILKSISKVKNKKKRKNKKSKKKKVVEPLQNNKPNFGYQNQIGGGGGGVGGTSYNPFNQQRLTPSVTTVVNTPSNGGQTGGQNIPNPLSTAGLIKEEKFLDLTNDLNKKFQSIEKYKNDLDTTLNIYDNRFKKIKQHGLNLTDGFNMLVELYNNPLSDIQSGTFREPPQGASKDDRFGVIAIQQPLQEGQPREQDQGLPTIEEEPPQEEIPPQEEQQEEFMPYEEVEEDENYSELLSNIKYNLNEEYNYSEKTDIITERLNKITEFLDEMIKEAETENIKDVYNEIQSKVDLMNWGDYEHPDDIVNMVYKNLGGLMKEYNREKKKIQPTPLSEEKRRESSFLNDFVIDDPSPDLNPLTSEAIENENTLPEIGSNPLASPETKEEKTKLVVKIKNKKEKPITVGEVIKKETEQEKKERIKKITDKINQIDDDQEPINESIDTKVKTIIGKKKKVTIEDSKEADEWITENEPQRKQPDRVAKSKAKVKITKPKK